MTSIDIIIPSYRLQPKYLIPMLELKAPDNIEVNYIVVCDNPEIDIPKELLTYIEQKHVTFICNKINMGAASSRNIGIDTSKSEWILLLDDDVLPSENLLYVYVNAIKRHLKAIGFMGTTLFPKPFNNYTAALKVSGVLSAFNYAEYSYESICATTSNVMIRRSCLTNDIRFDKKFPKMGGGEDFAFFLDLYNKTNYKLICVKEAVVHHHWWENGKRDYNRLIRWGAGKTILFKKGPKLTFYDFPNMIESLTLVFVFFIMSFIINIPLKYSLITFFSIICVDYAIELLRLLKTFGFKYRLSILIESIFIINMFNANCFFQVLYNKKIKYLFKRQVYFDEKDKLYTYKLSVVKWTAYSFISIILFLLLS